MPIRNLTGQKFGTITFLRPTNKRGNAGTIIWEVECDCGRKFETTANSYLKGQPNCGYNCSFFINPARKFKNPKTSTYNTVLKTVYADGDLKLDEFIYLSQFSCFYCNSAPNNSYNKSSKTASIVYSGLDRVDNDKPHNLNNCLPACHTCNAGKNDLDLLYFTELVTNIHNNKENALYALNNNQNIIDNILKTETMNKLLLKYPSSKIVKGKKHQHPILRSAKAAFKHYQTDGLTNDRFPLFFALSQRNCVYCNSKPYSCTYKKDKGFGEAFIYNGADRILSIDNNGKRLNHSNIYNLVTCCRRCNILKARMNPIEFYDHIDKIYNRLHIIQNAYSWIEKLVPIVQRESKKIDL